MLFIIWASLSLLATCINAIDVTVGPDNAFHPDTVHGSPGELVNFHFASSGFSASEATARLSDPCNTEGGFDSGTVSRGAEFSIVISTYNSIYVFSQNQCTQGVVMIVNPGPSDSVAHYQSVASNGAVQNQQPSQAPSTTTHRKTSSSFTPPASTMSKQSNSPTTTSAAANAKSTSMSAMQTTTSSIIPSPSSPTSVVPSVSPIAAPASASADSALLSVVLSSTTAFIVLSACTFLFL